MAGFVLKSHYTSTAERAAVVRRPPCPGVDVLGAIALNRAVGGMNPLAVEIAAREGARTVWLPTVDSVNESHEREAARRRQGAGVGASCSSTCASRGSRSSPCRWSTTRGAVLPETREVLAMIARHGMVLATGHLGRDEIFAVVDAARRGGRRGDRDHASRVPVAEPLGRGPEGARRARRAARALLHHAPHRQGHLGATGSRTSAPRGRSTRCCRPTSARSSTRRSRTAWR